MKIKNALIIYKKSTYQFYFFEHRSKKFEKELRLHPSMRTKFKKAHEEHICTLGHIKRVLKEAGIRFKAYYRGKISNYRPFDLVVTVGGDGTFLEAARHTKRQVILGVNSDPRRSIGRLCVANRQNFKGILKTVLGSRPPVKFFSRVSLWHSKSKRKINVLNDILICHKNPAAMSRYRLIVNGANEDQRSSGLWVATAIGSSGAIHSAGGKTLPRESKLVQYMPRELFCGHGAKYRLKGGVISLRNPMTVRSMMRNGVLYIDGAHFSLPFSFDDVIKFSISREPLRAVVLRK